MVHTANSVPRYIVPNRFARKVWVAVVKVVKNEGGGKGGGGGLEG